MTPAAVDALADELDAAAGSLDEIVRGLLPPLADASAGRVAGFSALWRMVGRLEGMALALRLVRAEAAP